MRYSSINKWPTQTYCNEAQGPKAHNTQHSAAITVLATALNMNKQSKISKHQTETCNMKERPKQNEPKQLGVDKN